MDDPYSILGLYPDCTYEEAKAAYRKAALMHHPDRHPPARKAEAERRFRILAHAFQHVSKELGHPINSTEGKSSNSNSPSPNTKTSTASNSSLVKSSTSAKPSAHSTKSISQPSNPQNPIDRPSETLKKLENHHHHQPVRSRKNSSAKIVQSEEPPPISPRGPLDEFSVFPSHSSRPNSSLLDDDEQDERPSERPAPRPPHPMDRRSSFSHPSERGSKTRSMMNDYDHSMTPKNYPERNYSDREQLYSPPRSNRDQDWDFGLGADNFFSSGMDRFGASSLMMDGIGLGFDRMMSSAFQGLSMAGPDPSELARMEDGNNCSMRMRQSKMVMGRTEDGSWAGKKMEKNMNMTNGRLEVSENAQDIRMGGAPSGAASRHPPPRNGRMRRGPEDWDPPPAYHGGETRHYGEEGYEPYAGMGSARRRGAGIMSPHGDMISGHARHGSLSRSSRSNLASMGGYYEPPSGIQRAPSSTFDYGPEPDHSSRPMGEHDLLLGHTPMGRSLARRPSCEIGARY